MPAMEVSAEREHMSTCATCKSWRTYATDYNLGHCERIVVGAVYTLIPIPPNTRWNRNELAFTPRDFGCILWEPAEVRTQGDDFRGGHT